MTGENMMKLSEDELNNISGGGVAASAAKGFLAGVCIHGVAIVLPFVGIGEEIGNMMRESTYAEERAGVVGALAGHIVGLGAIVGAGYSLAKRKKIARWIKSKFSKK